jgi:ribosomal protein S18 acetylase RimI-like enzyme
VNLTIRPLVETDVPAVIALSLRAWAPNFRSLEQDFGRDLFLRLHADWRTDQTAAVQGSCGDPAHLPWVGEIDGRPVGFVVVKYHGEPRPAGEIDMLAVDPDHQGRGLGGQLTTFALQVIRDAGYTLAFVGTGGDRGHAVARRTYESAGFTPIPVVHYVKVLA